jgi:hypothetical protein
MSQRRPSWVDRYLLRKRKGIRKGENHMRFLACTYDNTYSNVGLVAVYKRFGFYSPHFFVLDGLNPKERYVLYVRWRRCVDCAEEAVVAAPHPSTTCSLVTP